MRNPGRKALYCALALLIGAAAIGFGIDREQRIGEDWTAIAPMVAGLAIVPFALVILVQALFAARGQDLLLAGRGVIACWHVDPAEWDRFREVDARRSAEHPSLVNDLMIRSKTPPEGVAVIVGEKSLLVDRSYHLLRPRGLPELRGVGWLEDEPACLEFALAYPKGRHGGLLLLTLRIPVPAGALGAAQRVVAHFEPLTRRKPGLALRNPRKTYRICAMLALSAATLAGIGYALARALPDGEDPLAPLLMLIGGIGLGAFALILAAATFLLARPSRGG